MQEVPKIVRERLRATPPVVNHPDADTLTAFAERSLPELERSAVLDHLARCVDCRDIVALAVPAEEPVATVIRPAPSGWLTWPVLRWGFVAVGVVAIAAFGILQYQRRSQPAMMAYKAPAPQTAVPQAKKKAEARPVPSPPAEKRDKVPALSAPAFTDSLDAAKLAASEPKQVTPAEALPASTLATSAAHPIGGPATQQRFPHGPKMAMQWQQQNQNTLQVQAPVPAAPSAFAKQQGGAKSVSGGVPVASEVVEVQAQPLELEKEVQVHGEQVLAQEQSAGQSQSADDLKVGRAKPPVNVAKSSPAPAPAVGGVIAQQQGQDLTLNARNFNDLTVISPTALPRWTINSAGSLQRSFDQGKTWHDVDVTANPAPITGESSFALTATTSRAKESTSKKALEAPAATVVFRAVAVEGAEVWAGGSAGALYHSLDAGNHWTRVVPSSAGAILTSDIVSLDFSDTQHGKITTSDSTVWTTSDDGQTWQKQ